MLSPERSGVEVAVVLRISWLIRRVVVVVWRLEKSQNRMWSKDLRKVVKLSASGLAFTRYVTQLLNLRRGHTKAVRLSWMNHREEDEGFVVESFEYLGRYLCRCIWNSERHNCQSMCIPKWWMMDLIKQSL